MRRYWYGVVLVAAAGLAALLALAVWPVPLASADAQTLRVANELYTTGETAEAVRLYEQLVAGGIRNVEVFYNLGVAYRALGDNGQAMRYLRLAENLAPRDADIQRQLAALRAETGARAPARDLPQRLARSLENLVSPDETAAVALGVWLAFALLLFLTGALRPGFIRTVLRALSIIAGVFALVGILAFGARVYVLLVEPPAVVVNAASPAASPGAASERPALAPGAEVAVVARDREWVQILLPGSGNLGWVPASAVALVG